MRAYCGNIKSFLEALILCNFYLFEFLTPFQVEIFAFGVEELNVPELKSVASSVQNHVFVMSTFRQFARFAQKIHGGK